jgi:hypothetical protein
MCQLSAPASGATGVSHSLPSALLVVSRGFDSWVREGPARRYFNVNLTVRVTDNVTTVCEIAAEYAAQQEHFDAVCLASCHGHEREPRLKWKFDGHSTLTQTAVKAVAKITKRVHIITCWQGLFLQFINVPGLVISGYNTWINSYGEDENGIPIEPEPWQLHYIGCGLPAHKDNSVEHYDDMGQSCRGRCRAEAGKLVVKSLDNKLSTI